MSSHHASSASGGDGHKSFMKLYTVSEVCLVLKVSKATVYRLMAEDGLRYFRVGSSRRFTQRMLDEYVKSKPGGEGGLYNASVN